jgi:putative flippase GtrA
MEINNDKSRYLLAGAWNTVFGYGVGVGLYTFFSPRLNTVLIAILANLIAISMSFMTYKLFVFRTRGNWMREYLRSYVAYGGTAILGIFLFWFLIDILSASIWLTQLLLIILTATISYFTQKYFTFKVVE